MSRTVAVIEADIAAAEATIAAIKAFNPDWVSHDGDKALITALTTKKNDLWTEIATIRAGISGSVFAPPVQTPSNSSGSGGTISVDETSATKKKTVEIVIKEEGEFLDLTHVPDLLKLRSGLGRYLYMRDCYNDFMDDIFTSLKITHCKTVAILGTAGIGKSSLLFVVLKLLLEDPSKFGLTTRSFYFQTLPNKIWLCRHVRGGDFSVALVERGEWLDASIPMFADMETEAAPNEHGGVSLIFTSFKRVRYRELTKNGWRKVLPTWSADEQAAFFNSPQFREDYGAGVAQRACENIQYFGGAIESNIQVALSGEDPGERIKEEVQCKGAPLCERFFWAGFGGPEEAIPDVLVHRNPQKREDGSYDYNVEAGVISFASPHVFRRLLQMQANMCATAARNEYSAGSCL